MAAGPSCQRSPPEEPASPTSYCVRYEGNGSKRWDGKTIFVDSKALLDLYDCKELVPGKEVSIPWKSKTKGVEHWKAIIVDITQKEQSKKKEPPSTEEPPSIEKESNKRGRKRKTSRL